MPCQCYSVLCSAMLQIPTDVIIIITHYGHTFSDSEFDEINKYDEAYIIGNEDGTVEYSILGMQTCERDTDIWTHVIITRYSNSIKFWFMNTFKDDDQNLYNIDTIENIYEFINTNFGQDFRDNIWNEMCPDEPMPQRFIVMCDTVIRIITDWLYSKPRILMCQYKL